VVKEYDFSTMNAPSLANAMELFAKVHELLEEEKDKKVRAFRQDEMMAAYEKAAHSLLYTDAPADDEILIEKSDEFAERLRGRRQYDRMNELYLKTFERLKNPALKADAAIKLGTINVVYLEKYKVAENFFNQVLTELKVNDATLLRRAYIGLGDTYRFIGDHEKSLSFYEKAEEINVTGQRSYAQDQARKGGLSRMIEAYIRDGDHEAATDNLNTWLWEYPLDRLSGYANILVAKNYALAEDYRLAVNELLSVARVDPKNNYAAEALYLAAEYLMKMRQNEQAQKVLQQLVRQYPETPLKEQVEILIKKLEIIK
jgi:TolA-binding protein